MVALLGQAPDEQLAGVEIILEVGHEASSGDVRICALAGDVLADAIDDQHVDVVKPEAGKARLGDPEQLAVAGNDLLAGIDADL